MTIILMSENPLRYKDTETDKDVPVKTILDAESGETISYLVVDGEVIVAHLPKGTDKYEGWKTAIGIKGSFGGYEPIAATKGEP